VACKDRPHRQFEIFFICFVVNPAHPLSKLQTLSFIILQATFGAVAVFAPSLLGGEGRAKSLYKYHRFVFSPSSFELHLTSWPILTDSRDILPLPSSSRHQFSPFGVTGSSAILRNTRGILSLSVTRWPPSVLSLVSSMLISVILITVVENETYKHCE